MRPRITPSFSPVLRFHRTAAPAAFQPHAVQVHVDERTVQGLVPPRIDPFVEILIQLAGRVLGEKRVPQRASVISSTRRTLTPARYISINASSTDDSRRRYRSIIYVSEGSERSRHGIDGERTDRRQSRRRRPSRAELFRNAGRNPTNACACQKESRPPQSPAGDAAKKETAPPLHSFDSLAAIPRRPPDEPCDD